MKNVKFMALRNVGGTATKRAAEAALFSNQIQSKNHFFVGLVFP
jgi:hypothetical protein